MYEEATTISIDTVELEALINDLMKLIRELIQTGRKDAFIKKGMQNYITMLVKQLKDAGITVEPYCDWKQEYPTPEEPKS